MSIEDQIANEDERIDSLNWALRRSWAEIHLDPYLSFDKGINEILDNLT